jgi:hypothetical protein
MDTRTKGAWILHHAAKLRQVTDPSEFDSLYAAGKAGILLSSLASTEEHSLSSERVNALARAQGLSPKVDVPGLLAFWEGQHLISREDQGIKVLGVTQDATLSHVSELFDTFGPEPRELAVIDIAERVSNQPDEKAHLLELVGDSFALASGETATLLDAAEDIGFIDHEDIDQDRTLYFNGNLFRRENTLKAQAILSSLTDAESRRVQELDETLRGRGCIDLQEVSALLGRPLLDKLHAIGMLDVNELNNDKESVLYVTRPGAFGKYGNPLVEDAMDLAKAFVTCLTYGMTRSTTSRGRITMLEALMRRLLAGAWVGPAPAIGADYRVLELAGVIKVRHDQGSYSMCLLKKDVGQLALRVLTEGDASDQSLTVFPGAAASKYIAPEKNRVAKRKRQNPGSKKAMNELLLALRTGGG